MTRTHPQAYWASMLAPGYDQAKCFWHKEACQNKTIKHPNKLKPIAPWFKSNYPLIMLPIHAV